MLWPLSRLWGWNLRFVEELVVWPKEFILVSRTQPKDPLCLRQCLRLFMRRPGFDRLRAFFGIRWVWFLKGYVNKLVLMVEKCSNPANCNCNLTLMCNLSLNKNLYFITWITLITPTTLTTTTTTLTNLITPAPPTQINHLQMICREHQFLKFATIKIQND